MVSKVPSILTLERKTMKELFIDIETYSDMDLAKCGVYRYAQSINFEILLFAYLVDGGEVHVVDIKEGEKIPKDITKALFVNSVKKICLQCSI